MDNLIREVGGEEPHRNNGDGMGRREMHMYKLEYILTKYSLPKMIVLQNNQI